MYRTLSLSFFVCCVLLLAGRSDAAEQKDTGAADEQVLKAAKVVTDGPALLHYLRKRSVPIDPEAIKKLVKQLGDDSFQVRQKATNDLAAIGQPAVAALREAANDNDPEVARRAEDCLRLITHSSTAPVSSAVVGLIGLRKPAGAAEVLLAYLPFAENRGVTQDVGDALTALAVRNGKADPVLVAALKDKLPSRRAIAAEALVRAADQRPALRKLLQDSDVEVRSRVALALAYAKEKEAIPVLIELLAEPQSAQRARALAVLHDLAEDRAPKITSGDTEASRKKYRDAWAAWWRAHGGKVDLGVLQDKPRILGHTLIVLLDAGKVIDLDAGNKPAWQIEGLQFPLDVQLVSNQRVLIAEHLANRVTERKHTGAILWEKSVPEPLSVQRLSNGNTFIGTKSRLMEVDRAGNEVFSYQRPNGDPFMRAVKLPKGDIACVTNTPDALPGTQKFVRLDATGKELISFPVEVWTSGGKIDVLRDGGVLIPQMANNRVVELDAKGRQVRQFTVEQPIVAMRLANGNTLVTSMTQMRAIELDRDGKQVWEFKADTRVTRALRH